MLSIGIVGSREFTDQTLMRRVIKALVQKHGPFRLVSGGAKGADSLAAEEHAANVPEGGQTIHLPNHPDAYRAFGQNFRDRAFGRNAWIVRDSDFIVAFFVTPEMKGGTLNTVNHARRSGKAVYAHMGDGRWVVEDPSK